MKFDVQCVSFSAHRVRKKMERTYMTSHETKGPSESTI